MSHGTPAIVRRIGALAENLQQSGGGLDFATLGECRDAMETLRTQPELRERLGRAGAAAVEALWSPEAHLRQYLDLVGTLLAQRSAVRGVAPPVAAHV
jgi:glycosyltransferase involved in cell wall biosynthesis